MAFKKSNTSFVWLDTETGGTDPLQYPIIQAAFVATGPMPDFEVIEELEVKFQFNPEVCSPEALEKNSYDSDVWEKEAVPPPVAVLKIKEFLERHCSREMTSRQGNKYYVTQAVGHNVAKFDLPALQKLFKDHGEFFPISFLSLDTLYFIVAMYWLTGLDLKSFSMDALAEYFEIEAGGHDALADVHSNIALMRKFLKEGLR